MQAQGSQPIGTKDVTVVDNAFEIADLWLNEATVFPATTGSTSQRSVSRLDWVDETLKGWQATMEPLATGLSSAISSLLDDAMAQQAQDVDSGEAMAAPMGAIAGLLRTFIGSLIATQLGQAIGGISRSWLHFSMFSGIKSGRAGSSSGNPTSCAPVAVAEIPPIA